MRNIIIFGASRGLGNSIVDGIAKEGDKFYLISRTEPQNLRAKSNFEKIWIKSDLSDLRSIQKVYISLKGIPIDIFLYNAGIWEEGEFEKISQLRILEIIQVNLSSLILLVQKLIPNIRRGVLKKIIIIGSSSGLENEGSSSIIYTATKFGVRGVTHSLREYLRNDSISVSCISAGSIASDIPYSKGKSAALKKYSEKRIPVSDIIDVIKVIIETSIASCIKEVYLPALKDRDM